VSPLKSNEGICLVASSPLTVNTFLKGHVSALSKRFEVTVIANCDGDEALEQLGPGVHRYSVGIRRKVAPLGDLLCLLRLTQYFRRGKFVAVHSVTPKAGLLAMAAAQLARVPVRIHWFTGQVWAARSGLERVVLRKLDWLTASLSTHLLVDSHSQREFLALEGVARRDKMRVLAEGSICGVDGDRFRPDIAARMENRAALDLPEDAVVFLFLGRCTFDKGLTDLAKAFEAFCEERDDGYLMVVGPDEEEVFPAMLAMCPRAAGRVRRLNHTDAPERVMAAADVFCLPSYREGFGAVVIEAAAVGIPSIGSRIYGIIDAIQDGQTGLLHKPREPHDLLEKMKALACDATLRHAMGARARVRAMRDFSSEAVTCALLEFYNSVFGPCTQPD
jgi:glycosyltransferase involved in cell wall biosynthesis